VVPLHSRCFVTRRYRDADGTNEFATNEHAFKLVVCMMDRIAEAFPMEAQGIERHDWFL